MSYQSGWSYYEQPIKLLFIKVNLVWGYLIPILGPPSLFFHKQERAILDWPYFEISDAAYTIAVSRGHCG